MMQPYTGGNAFRTWAAMMAALIVIALFLGITRSRHEVLNSTFDFSAPAATTTSTDSWTDTAPKPESSRVIFTAPFTLTGNRNLEIVASAPVHNSWMYVAGDIGDEQQSGLLEPFDLPIEYYEGYDGGEHWTEGSTTKHVYISALPPGTYTMRLEGQWDEKGQPTPVHLIVREGVFRWSHFILAFLLLTIPAILTGFKRISFETQRWNESQYTAVGTEKESSSDED